MMENLSNQDDFLSASFLHFDTPLFDLDQTSPHDIWHLRPPILASGAGGLHESTSNGQYISFQADIADEIPATCSLHEIHPLKSPIFNTTSTKNGTSLEDHIQGPPIEFMAPPQELRKPRAPTLRDSDWQPYKIHIVELYITKKLPLQRVKEIMEAEHGFIAEIRQYRSRITLWKLDKNVKPREMKAIVRKRQQRQLVDVGKRGLVFRVRGSVVDPQKIERWMKKHNISDSTTFTESLTSSTPSGVSCRTISEPRPSDVGSNDSKGTTLSHSKPLAESAPTEPALVEHPITGHNTHRDSPVIELDIFMWDVFRIALRDAWESNFGLNTTDLLDLYLKSQLGIENLAENWATWISEELFPGDTEARNALVLGFLASLAIAINKSVRTIAWWTSLHLKLSKFLFEDLESWPLGSTELVPDDTSPVYLDEYSPLEFSITLLFAYKKGPVATFGLPFLPYSRMRPPNYDFLSKFKGTIYHRQRGRFEFKINKKAAVKDDTLNDGDQVANTRKRKRDEDEAEADTSHDEGQAANKRKRNSDKQEAEAEHKDGRGVEAVESHTVNSIPETPHTTPAPRTNLPATSLPSTHAAQPFDKFLLSRITQIFS